MRFFSTLFALLFIVLHSSARDFGKIRVEDIDVLTLQNEMLTWTKEERTTERFEKFIKVLALPTELQLYDWRTFTGVLSIAVCTVCQAVLGNFILFRREGMSEKNIGRKVKKLCTLLNFQTEEVCSGLIDSNLPILLYIVDNKPNLSASTICGVVLESKSCPLNNKEYEWSIELDDKPILFNKTESQSNETLSVLQISDIHYDPKYEPYSNVMCAEPTCCRKGQNATNNSSQVAGYWGDYNNCDTPWHTVEDALDHINGTHKNIDYVYYTGDIVDHGVWETSIERNTKSIIKIFTAIYETFNTIPVFPIAGNHEPHPLNQFAPSNITVNGLSTQWLYNLLADLWIGFGWIPESARATVAKGGFYTVSPRKGLRVISLNNNVCYCYNWWLLYEPQDPYGQLKWLVEVLSQAEKDGESVHILIHLPIGDLDCQSTWRREYIRIVNRYSHIIKAQFSGHTHNDQFEIVYRDLEAQQPTNVAWNGGSITAYSKLNPNYKLYEIDVNTCEVNDYDNWIYNIATANEYPDRRPAWYKSYSFKEEYNLSNLSLNSLNKWLSTAKTDSNMLNRYYINFFKRAAPSLQSMCDIKCKQMYINRIVTTLPH